MEVIMINNVSFGNVPASTFSDMVNRPQAYKSSTTPAAAAGVSGDSFTTDKPKKKHTLLKLALGAAAVGAALVAGNKTGLTAKLVEKCPTIGNPLKTAGEWLEKKAGNIVEWAKDKIHGKVPEAAEEVAETLV